MRNIKSLLRKPLVKVFAKSKQSESSPEVNPTPVSNPALEQVNGPALEAGPFRNLDPQDLKVQSDQSQKKIDTLPPDVVDEVIRQFAQKYGTTPPLATIGIAALCQAGGTNAGNPSLKRTINGITFDLQVLRSVVSYVAEKGTVRQLAKSMRDVIAKISIANDWPGPLANALVKEFPDKKFDSTDLVYAAEFHDDNRCPEFPAAIAEALAIREARGREARRNQVKPGSKTKKSKKKKGQ